MIKSFSLMIAGRNVGLLTNRLSLKWKLDLH